MKKGFTLVELLAVIVILAIILAIAVPSISSMINNAQRQAFIDNEKMIIKATKMYIGIDTNMLPINIGDTKEVTLNTLQSNNYIGIIKDPKDKAKTCNGYVLITKTDSNNYNYEPYLNCESDIKSSSEDGLAAHYTFDDFQEPTINYARNGNVNNMDYWGASPNTTLGDAITGTLITNDGVGDNTSIEFNVVSRPSWGYTQHSLTSYLPVGWFDTTSKYTLSFYAKRITGTSDPTVAIKEGNGSNIVMNHTSFILNSEWKKYEYTFTPLCSGNFPVVFFSMPQDNVYRIDSLQLEKKEYATPYVTGSRSGQIKDYSLNNNHTTLEVTKTPRWVTDSISGNGAYSFDGVDDYINLGSVSESVLRQGTEANDFTLSAWIKMSSLSSNTSIILARPGFHLGLQVSATRSVYFGVYDDASNGKSVSSTALSTNEWHYAVAVYSNKIMYLYIDGKLVGSNNYFNQNPTVKFKLITSNFTIGSAGGGNHQFKGSIDDARIYTRALSTDEIKYNYDIMKNK
jgi:type IV pilus assembly protein PilA